MREFKIIPGPRKAIPNPFDEVNGIELLNQNPDGIFEWRLYKDTAAQMDVFSLEDLSVFDTGVNTNHNIAPTRYNDFYLTSMCIPRLFDGFNSAEKYAYQGLFLLRPEINSLDVFPSSSDHGPRNCPIKVGVTTPSNNDYFEFNRNRFYPMILPSLQTFYYATETFKPFNKKDSANGNAEVSFYDAEKHLLAGYGPIEYDSILGIFTTREIQVLDRSTQNPLA